MSVKNLTDLSNDLGQVYGLGLKKGQKDPFRKKLENHIPQVFVQDLRELEAEIDSMSQSHKSKLKNGEEMVVPAIITLPKKQVINLYKIVFNAERNRQFSATFNGKTVGTDGIILTKAVWRQLHREAKAKAGTTKALICPCRNLNAAADNIKTRFAQELAKQEIQNRKGTDRDPGAREEIEQDYVKYRLTGYQSARIKHGSKEKYRPEGLTEYEKNTGIQLGHGDLGSATYEYRLDEAKKLIQNAKGLDKKHKRRLLRKIAKIEEEYQVKVQHIEDISFTKGLKKQYKLLIISGQRTSGNMEDQLEEKDTGIAIQNLMKEMILEDHDSRLDETIGGLILRRLTHNNKGVRNRSKRYRPKKKVSSRERAQGKKNKVKINHPLVMGDDDFNLGAIATDVVKKSKRTKKPLKRRQASSVSTVGSPMHVISVLNASLETAIRDNMGEPALVNRTGRFAESVRVVNIAETKNTSGTIQYTYQRNPYEIFEGDGNRDPRILIDKTLREQAAERALGEFTTQRI